MPESRTTDAARRENGPGARVGNYRPEVGAVRYIGSKARLLEAIVPIIGEPDGGRFVDAFCGTGVVASAVADRGWPVALNDHLISSVAVARARLLATSDVPFSRLGGYERIVERLNALPDRAGYITHEYSPAGPAERMYFSTVNASRIDAVRRQIEEWTIEGQITPTERDLLVADLIGAAARVANIAGTYGHFLSHWSSTANRPFVMAERSLRRNAVDYRSHTLDVFDVPTQPEDTAYFDPPYTKRQYAAYYHVNETLAYGDEPVVSGKSGLRPWQDRASDFCYKRRALLALTRLLDETPAQRVLLSYSSEGHVALGDLLAAAEALGKITVHEILLVGRYRPNRTASEAASAVTEFVIELVKTPTVAAVPEEV